LRRQGRLSVHVVQEATSVRNREGSQRIEMQKIRALQVSVSVTECWSRDRPDVERPDGHREQQCLRPQPSRC